MPRYRLLLYDGSTTPPVPEPIEAAADDDARDLARIILLATAAYTHVEVWKGEALVETYKRDSCGT